MEIGEVIRVSLRALARNKMRTILTMLGIVIGVGAVICTVAIGQGAAKQVQEQIASLGDNIIFISAGSIKTSGVHLGSQATKSLTAEDGKAILAKCRLSSGCRPAWVTARRSSTAPTIGSRAPRA